MEKGDEMKGRVRGVYTGERERKRKREGGGESKREKPKMIGILGEQKRRVYVPHSTFFPVCSHHRLSLLFLILATATIVAAVAAVVAVVVVCLTASSPLPLFILVPPSVRQPIPPLLPFPSSFHTPLLTGFSHTTLDGSMVTPAPLVAWR